MTIGEWSPTTLETGIGYVRFAAPTDGGWEGKTVTLVDKEGAEHAGTVVALPFFDKEKRLPRGMSLDD